MRAKALVAGGFLVALAAFSASGCATGVGGSAGAQSAGSAAGRPASSVASCTAYAYRAIRSRERVSGMPAACRGLSKYQVNISASTAIRLASGDGLKSASRKRAGAAAPYVSALISQIPAAPAPATGGVPAGALTAGALTVSSGSRLGFSEPAARFAALLAWLATAASGGFVLIRWWRAGGSLARLRRGTATAAPPVVALGHVGLALLGLVLWALFMITGWAVLAWASVGLLASVSGLGMGILVLGLPSPRSPASAGAPPTARTVSRLPRDGRTAVLDVPAAAAAAPSPARSGRQPVLAIVAHGLFATATLMLVLLAAIGA